MEGFILAAGLGTRLRPLTDSRPKALVEVGGRTLLELAIGRLAEAGANRIVVNTFHFAGLVEAFVASRRWPCEVVVTDERPLLLDTGGALKHAAPLFSGREEVVVHNVDILSRIDLQQALRSHREQGNLATLCCSRRDTQRALRFDADGRLAGRDAGTPLPGGFQRLAFSGVSVVSPALFPLLPPADHPYPAIDEYVRLAQQGHPVRCFVHPAEGWLDVGRPETLKTAQQWIRSSNK